MSFKQLKILVKLCNYLQVKTLGDLQIIKQSCKITNNKDLLNLLYLESCISV